MLIPRISIPRERKGRTMTSSTPISLASVVVDCPDAGELAEFYRRLLGWEIGTNSGDWITLRPPGGGTGLSFQSESKYRRPVWPEQPGEQDKMLHLDIQVEDLDAAVAHAQAAGAVLASYQPQEGVRVMLDPAGHPFCLFVA
jgi:catechol 2,3-dioxygenase-like lactoylglutathione lyase family enzyme